MSRKWLCTNCGYTEEGHEDVNLYMTKRIECPKCHKCTLIPVNKFPITVERAINLSNWDKKSTWAKLLRTV